MPSLIDEQTQFTDTDGLPIVNGSLYIGTQNSDPVANPITIYSDRDLTTPISNPQSLDSYGRSTNKIFIPGKYSLQVNNSASVQKYQALDAGEISQTGITVLSNVQGTDTITAEAEPAITALVDQQQYNFTTAGVNTGAVTLQIDLTAAKSILKQHDVALFSGDLEANQIVSVIYNATDDVFELVSNVTASATDATFDTLTVTTSATIGGDPVVPARAVVANHIRAGNTQIHDGNSTTQTTFNVATTVTVDTWESIGPTGSGADNIWADLDVLPAEATILIVDVLIGVVPSGTGVASVAVNYTDGDGGSPPLDNPDNSLFQHSFDGDASTTSSTIQGRVHLPLGPTNQDFRIQWVNNGTTSETIHFYYRGFITD